MENQYLPGLLPSVTIVYMVRATTAALFLCLAATASASSLFTFNYTNIADNTFSFNEVSFTATLTSGLQTIPAGSQPTLVQGATTWTFTQFYMAPSGAGFCFILATSGLTNGNCNGFSGFSADQGEILTGFVNAAGVPTGNGSFSSPLANQAFDGVTAGNSFVSTTGSTSLTISSASSSAPEPTSFVLGGAGLLACLLARRRRS